MDASSLVEIFSSMIAVKYHAVAFLLFLKTFFNIGIWSETVLCLLNFRNYLLEIWMNKSIE